MTAVIDHAAVLAAIGGKCVSDAAALAAVDAVMELLEATSADLVTTPPRDRAAATIEDAVRAWYAEGFDGGAVLTGWYLIGQGTGFTDDGAQPSFIAQEWGQTDIVAQIGLTEYARQRVLDRMREETR